MPGIYVCVRPGVHTGDCIFINEEFVNHTVADCGNTRIDLVRDNHQPPHPHFIAPVVTVSAPIRDDAREHAYVAYSFLRHQIGLTPAEIAAAAPYLAVNKQIEHTAGVLSDELIETAMTSSLDAQEMIEAIRQGAQIAEQKIRATMVGPSELTEAA